MRLLSGLCVIVIFLTVTHAEAAGICWVDHVYKSGQGITVTFDTNSRIFVHHANVTPPAKLDVIYDPNKDGYQQRDENYQPVGTLVHAIPMEIGDEATLSNSPEDTCTVNAVEKEGVIGLSSDAFFYSNIPGDKPERRKEFVPATQELVGEIINQNSILPKIN